MTLIGRQVVVVAVPYQVYLVTHSSLAVGLLGLVQVVPQVASGLYGGHFADRFDRRRVIIVAGLLQAAVSAALALGAVGLRAPLWFVFLVTAASAGVSTVEHSARSATIPRLFPLSRLPAALSVHQVMVQLAQVAGPSLAGVLIAAAGLPLAYAVDILCFAVGLAFILRLRPLPVEHPPARLSWRAPAEGLRHVWKTEVLLGIFVADLVAMIFGMPRALFPALAQDVFQVGARGLGLLYAAPAAGALVATPLLGWIPRVRRQAATVLVAVAAWGVFITGFGFSGRAFALGLVLLALAGASDMVSAVFRHTLVQSLTPDRLRGRLSAFNSMVVTTGPRLGDLEAGAVASLTSPFFSVVSGGLLSLAGAAVLAVLRPGLLSQRSSAAQLPEDGDVVDRGQGQDHDASLDAAPDEPVGEI